MKETKVLPENLRLKIIEACVQRVQNGNATLDKKYQAIQDEIEEEMKSEDFFAEHGLSEAQEHDVKDEMSFLEEEEEVDYDADENEVNMDEISPHMREVYE
jgi:hypothetical protein